MSTFEYRLCRPNNSTVWGFRLQGGLDVNAPLTVQRVFNASPADGSLQRGDVILSINSNDVSAVYLKKAEELIKASTNSLKVVVRRQGQPVNSSRPQNDLLVQTQQQQSYLPFDNSPLPPKYGNPPVQPSTQQQQQWPSHQPQSNEWRPSGHSFDSSNDFGSTPKVCLGKKSGNLLVNSQWSSAGHDSDEIGGHQRTTNASSQSAPPRHNIFDDQSLDDKRMVQRGRPSGVSPSYARQQPRVSSPQQPCETAIHSLQTEDDDDDGYEAKSVRDIKQMFNSLTKPSPHGPTKAPNKPNVSRATFQRSADSLTTGNPRHPSNLEVLRQTASVTSPQEPSSSRYSENLYGSYPPPRQDFLTHNQNPMLQVSKALRPVVAQPKPGAGYSYQGIVTVTAAKTVNRKSENTSSGGGGNNQGSKKKEFDPSQSLVFLALQEENERAQRGDVASPDEGLEEPRAQKQQHLAPETSRSDQRGIIARSAASLQREQQRSSRLQELLDRDQVQSLHQQDESASSHMRGSSSPHVMTMQMRREQSPSYPCNANQEPNHWKHAHLQEHNEHRPIPSYHHPQHQQQHKMRSSASPSRVYQQRQYHGGYDRPSYGGASYSQDIPVSEF